MCMPLSRAWRPLALERMSGRFPWAGGARFAKGTKVLWLEGVCPNSLFALARALPARELRKNLRRDHNSMLQASRKSGGNIQQSRLEDRVESRGFTRPSSRKRALPECGLILRPRVRDEALSSLAHLANVVASGS